MATGLTLDACVFTAAFLPGDAGHQWNAELLRRTIWPEYRVFAPTLLLPEVCSAVARSTKSIQRGEVAAIRIQQFSALELVAIDYSLAEVTGRLASRCFLRGADAVYLALARLKRTPLVTNDRELREAAQAVSVQTYTSEEWLQSMRHGWQ